ncbi:helix-turn-helix domain-containing protein [Nocardioides sp.]|uniref:helix-turn-helix domain-containing protein n=1 Tax=Nocardioides sp. TaxID=35761 RepID=UPI00351130C9
MTADVPFEDRIFISAAEAAAVLNITTWSIYRLLDSGEIESRYFGRRRLVVRESVQRFAASLPDTAA